MANRPIVLWLRYLAVLAFGVGLAGGPFATAAAQEPTEVVRFSLGTEPPAALSLCVNQKKMIKVTVARETAQTRRFNQIHDVKVMSDVSIQAEVTDTSIGDIEQQLGNSEEDFTSYTQGYFFQAKHAGSTKVNFKSVFSVYRIPGSNLMRVPAYPAQQTVENLLNVTVKKCHPKVHSTHRWSSENAVLAGVLNETELNGDEQGNFTGQGTMTWLAHAINVFGCDSSVSVDEYAPSQVDLTGQMDESGQLSIQMSFQPIEDSVTVVCVKRLEGTTEDHYSVVENLAALSLDMPEAGGVTSQPQALVYGRQNTSLMGEAVVDVELETDEATSSTFDSRTGRLGLGDRFGLLFGPK